MNVHDIASQIDIDDAGAALAASSGRLALIAVAAVVVTRILKQLIRRIDDHRTQLQLLYFAPKLVAIMSVFAAVAAIGIDVSGMAAVMATVGITGAVVFTPVGQNLVAGAMIRVDDVYDIGDIITVNDRHGRVVFRSLLRTELELPDGSTAWVPNSTFQDNDVLNHSRLGGWRVCVQVPLDRAADRRRAQAIMDRVVRDLPWNQPGRPASVAFDQIASEAMIFNAFAWIADRSAEPYYRGLLLDALVDALEEEGVSVGQTTNLSISDSREIPIVPIDRR